VVGKLNSVTGIQAMLNSLADRPLSVQTNNAIQLCPAFDY